jgi:hypothetical protein
VPLAGPATLTATQLLVNLLDHLHDQPPEITIFSNQTHLKAVCWNWVLMGGAAETEVDPKWAYLFVSERWGVEDETAVRRRANSHPECLRLLTEAHRVWKGSGAFPSAPKQDQVHKLVWHALLTFHEFIEDEGSQLQVVVYYAPGDRQSGIMYVHAEFVFADEITLTKGIDEGAKVFHGASVVTGENRSFRIGIRPSSLRGPHMAVLRDFQRQIDDGTAAKSKKAKGGEEKETQPGKKR